MQNTIAEKPVDPMYKVYSILQSSQAVCVFLYISTAYGFITSKYEQQQPLLVFV